MHVFISGLYDRRRIPVVSHVTLQMQSDAVESENTLSLAAKGNDGQPKNPGDAAVDTTPPPNCLTIACTVMVGPDEPGDKNSTSTQWPMSSGYLCPPGDPHCAQLCTAAGGAP